MDNAYENARNYIWNYFELHAKQRLTTFNYYIVISTLLASGYLLAIQNVTFLSLLLSIVLMLLSFIFWKLDLRNKQLIKNSENALKFIERKESTQENEEQSEILQIFSYEEKQTDALRDKKVRFFWNKLYTYSTCLNGVFILFAFIGFCGLINSIVELAKGQQKL